MMSGAFPLKPGCSFMQRLAGFSSLAGCRPQNLIEKIVQNHQVSSEYPVFSGDFTEVAPAHVMTHDNTGAVIQKFESMKIPRVHSPRQIVFTLDHNVQDKSEKNLEKYRRIEEFAKQHGIDFYRAGRGIGHQVMCEEAYALPGLLVVASDSHSNMYGGLACLGTPVVRTDAAVLWGTGRTWWQVPPVTRVLLSGELQPGVTGKDVIITLCGTFNKDEVLNHCIEFSGPGVASLTVEERLTIANMTTEWGALAGVFPVDDVLLQWLSRRAAFLAARGPAGVPSDPAPAQSGYEHPRLNSRTLQALRNSSLAPDPGCNYAQTLHVDLGGVQPHVSGPDDVKKVERLDVVEQRGVRVHKAYLVSCVNSRVQDIAAAAAVVAGQRVHPDVKFYVAAASNEVEKESRALGHWQTLVDAGAIELPPGCGPCIGLGTGLLEDGEVGISATNRNFKGRMGSRSASAYLASPAVVAASAVRGIICGPAGAAVNPRPLVVSREVGSKSARAEPVPVIPNFPKSITADVVCCLKDNINTDGIYAGKYTYKDDMTREQQASVVMETYDPRFHEFYRPGAALVVGFNFGTGSSREQAATALAAAGIPLVIAGSLNSTFLRNALNNGLLCVESADLVVWLKDNCGGADHRPTVPLEGWRIAIDFPSAVVCITTQAGKERRFPFTSPGPVAQELIVHGGLENVCMRRLSAQVGG